MGCLVVLLMAALVQADYAPIAPIHMGISNVTSYIFVNFPHIPFGEQDLLGKHFDLEITQMLHQWVSDQVLAQIHPLDSRTKVMDLQTRNQTITMECSATAICQELQGEAVHRTKRAAWTTLGRTIGRSIGHAVKKAPKKIAHGFKKRPIRSAAKTAMLGTSGGLIRWQNPDAIKDAALDAETEDLMHRMRGNQMYVMDLLNNKTLIDVQQAESIKWLSDGMKGDIVNIHIRVAKLVSIIIDLKLCLDSLRMSTPCSTFVTEGMIRRVLSTHHEGTSEFLEDDDLRRQFMLVKPVLVDIIKRIVILRIDYIAKVPSYIVGLLYTRMSRQGICGTYDPDHLVRIGNELVEVQGEEGCINVKSQLYCLGPIRVVTTPESNCWEQFISQSHVKRDSRYHPNISLDFPAELLAQIHPITGPSTLDQDFTKHRDAVKEHVKTMRETIKKMKADLDVMRSDKSQHTIISILIGVTVGLSMVIILAGLYIYIKFKFTHKQVIDLRSEALMKRLMPQENDSPI